MNIILAKLYRRLSPLQLTGIDKASGLCGKDRITKPEDSPALHLIPARFSRKEDKAGNLQATDQPQKAYRSELDNRSTQATLRVTFSTSSRLESAWPLTLKQGIGRICLGGYLVDKQDRLDVGLRPPNRLHIVPCR